MVRVFVLRYGHRPLRDKRISTHVALVARAFGANGILISDIVDEKLNVSIRKVIERWGGSFLVEMGVPWKKAILDWKKKGGIIVHLTMYGENIESSDVLQRIKQTKRDIIILVGSKKVPPDFYYLADFNVAIGNQPHSEVAALAVFLDRFFSGRELLKEFENSLVRIIPQKKGKKVIKIKNANSSF